MAICLCSFLSPAEAGDIEMLSVRASVRPCVTRHCAPNNFWTIRCRVTIFTPHMLPTKVLDKFKDGWPRPIFSGGKQKKTDKIEKSEHSRTPAHFFLNFSNYVRCTPPVLPISFLVRNCAFLTNLCQINEIKNSAKITLPSTFCFQTVSLQPLDLLMDFFHIAHIQPLGVVDVPFGGHDHWPISWPTISAKITLLSTFHFWTVCSSATNWVVDGFLPYCTHTTLKGDVPFGVVTVDLFYDLRPRPK